MDINNLLKEKLIAQNPKMKQVLEMMEQQSETIEDLSLNEKIKLHIKKLTIALKREIGKNKVLQKEIEAIEDEVQFIDEINDELAVAVGACPECWGRSEECEICDGKGKAGNFPVDRKAFIKHVLPAIRETPWVKQILMEQTVRAKQSS